MKMRKSREFFVCQQGFAVPTANPHLYSALILQPRIIGVLVMLGTAFQSPGLFLVVAAVLAWATIVPRQNLFDAIYNHVVAFPRGWPPLGSAPAPRRFAQGSAAALALAVGLALWAGATTTAWLLEGVFLVGVASAVVRRFCLPAHLYHVLRRRLSPAPGITGASQPC
jgi:hypothetical protein